MEFSESESDKKWHLEKSSIYFALNVEKMHKDFSIYFRFLFLVFFFVADSHRFFKFPFLLYSLIWIHMVDDMVFFLIFLCGKTHVKHLSDPTIMRQKPNHIDFFSIISFLTTKHFVLILCLIYPFPSSGTLQKKKFYKEESKE